DQHDGDHDDQAPDDSARPASHHFSVGGMSPIVRGPKPRIHQSSRSVLPTNGPDPATSSPVSAQYATNVQLEKPSCLVLFTIASSGVASGVCVSVPLTSFD